MPKAYGYCRASTGKQELTFEVQQRSITKYYEDKLAGLGYEWGGFYEDKATSGGKPFSERDKGRELFVVAQNGDAIIWHKMDRAFRSVQDGASTFNLMRVKGISVHSLDIQLDTSTPLGSFVCHLLMLLGELERSWVSSRTSEALAERRAKGLPMSSAWPPGWRAVGKKKERHLIEFPEERALLDQVYQDFMAGESMERISNRLFFKGQKRGNKQNYDCTWLAYAMFCRAKGYPRDAHFKTWRESHKSISKKGRNARFSLRQALSETEALMQAQESGSSS